MKKKRLLKWHSCRKQRAGHRFLKTKLNKSFRHLLALQYITLTLQFVGLKTKTLSQVCAQVYTNRQATYFLSTTPNQLWMGTNTAHRGGMRAALDSLISQQKVAVANSQ